MIEIADYTIPIDIYITDESVMEISDYTIPIYLYEEH